MKQYIIFPLMAAGLLAMPQLTHASANAGDLVVCDGNSSVYLVADDGKRYVFPNESIYSTHFSNFDDVETIPCAELGELPLGGIVKYRHGSTLVKIQSSETVYAVAHGGKLLPIPSEEVAIALYGPDWARLVVDIPSSFFSFFEKGETIQEDELPEGMLLENEDGVLLEVNEDGDAVEVEDLVESTQNRDRLDRIARPLSEMEERLNKQIRIRNLVEEALESGDDSELDALLELLEPVVVPRERRAEDVRVNDGTVSARDAQKELNKAVRELERAEQKILKREEQGKDVSVANDLLAEAGSLYNQARAAFDADDFAAAEELAEEARDKAKEARMGWAISDDDDVEEFEDEDTGEDELEDEDLTDDEEDADVDTEEDLTEDEEDADEDLEEEDMDDEDSEDLDEDEEEDESEDESEDDEE